MLGWVIELPPHRAERLLAILQSLLQKRRVSLKIWQQHIGELQSMALALPGGRATTPTHPLAYVDIYVDDFLALAQGLPQTLDNVRTTLFNAIDEVFRQLHPSDQLFHRNEPVSIKKN